MISKPFRTLAIAFSLLAAAALDASAQPYPQQGQPGQQAQVCQRLEAQLAAIDRGGSNDPARAEQIRRFEDAVNKQQGDLDRLIAQGRRLGCDRPGFLGIFGGASLNPQCGPLNSQIQQMRGSLDRMMADLQQLQRPGMDYERDGQRRAILAALVRSDCGPQYRAAAAAAAPQSRNLFETLFGGGRIIEPEQEGMPVMGGSYRTICVRTCDGYYFPISFQTSPARFADDEQTCQRMCPATEAMLFAHRNPGEEVAQAVSTGGRLYTELPNAFKYRQEFNAACSCKLADTNPTDASKGADNRDTIEPGDIVVTQDRAKAMSAPRDARGRPIKPQTDAKAQTTAQPAASETPADPAGNKPIRTVGPQLGPVR